MSADTIFAKIIRGEIPCRKVYEDHETFAFHDINPAAEVHFLIVPKKPIPSLADISIEDAPLLGRMLALAPQLAAELGLSEGFRTSINTGRLGGQEVYHLHIHVYGNRPNGQKLVSLAG